LTFDEAKVTSLSGKKAIVTLTVVCEVELDDPEDEFPPTVLAAVTGAKDAIYNAIKRGQGEGHVHDLSDTVSVITTRVEATGLEIHDYAAEAP
jgi:hypothetical protein